MALIQWTDDFSVNNAEIDQQHKRWIEIYNSAHERMMEDGSSVAKKDIGRDALTEMLDYGTYHFDFEENHMKSIGYKDLERHQKIHREFSEKLSQVTRQLHNGEYVLNSEIIKMIENWLIQHILNEDQKYAEK